MAEGGFVGTALLTLGATDPTLLDQDDVANDVVFSLDDVTASQQSSTISPSSASSCLTDRGGKVKSIFSPSPSLLTPSPLTPSLFTPSPAPPSPRGPCWCIENGFTTATTIGSSSDPLLTFLLFSLIRNFVFSGITALFEPPLLVGGVFRRVAGFFKPAQCVAGLFWLLECVVVFFKATECVAWPSEPPECVAGFFKPPQCEAGLFWPPYCGLVDTAAAGGGIGGVLWTGENRVL